MFSRNSPEVVAVSHKASEDPGTGLRGSVAVVPVLLQFANAGDCPRPDEAVMCFGLEYACLVCGCQCIRAKRGILGRLP